MATDYERIAHAIDYIRANVDRQPALADIAGHVHLSEYHFQRLFSRWAGVTPKRFLQTLTLEHAKALLRDGQQTTLSASADVGLTSSSRLHEHFVQLEAVTPAEYRRRGAGLEIVYGTHDTPFGPVFVAQTERGICRLEFMDDDVAAPLAALRAAWPAARCRESAAATAAPAAALAAAPEREAVPLSLWVRGTNFQISVWRALLAIPPGAVCSYGDLARQLGKPGAARAIGTAVGANPVALLIPCHRVLRQSGQLGGYRWGAARKHAMLVREAARAQ